MKPWAAALFAILALALAAYAWEGGDSDFGGGSDFGDSSSFSGSSYSGSSGGSSDGWGALILFGLILATVFVLVVVGRGYQFGNAAEQKKIEQTAKFLHVLGQTNSGWNKAELERFVSESFVRGQRAWEARDYAQVKDIVTPELYSQHTQQLEKMKQDHEINRVLDLSVRDVKIVHVENHTLTDQDMFLARVTAKGKNQIIDDRTGEVLRTDDVAKVHTEYRVYIRKAGKWLLAAIRPPDAVRDLIKKENFDAEMTPTMMKWVYEQMDEHR